MKKKMIKKLLIIILIFLNVQISNAQKTRAADRLEKRNTIVTIYPEMKFDAKEAEKSLESGNSSIKGVLFTKEKTRLGIKPVFGVKIFGANINVTLFPVTTYFENWYELRRKKENKRTNVSMSEEAFAKKIIVKTDDYGRFLFEKMKPGKYFLQAVMNTEYDYYNTVNVGAEQNSSGGTTIYTEKQYFTINQDERIEKFVEIKENGEIVEIKLK
jgi:hypothetical protein